MREANSFDIFLLVLLGLIWGSSFFNIKIATYSYEPITLALVRVIFASAPLILLCITSQRGSTILIEQPELHLHPRVQQKFGDFLIKVMEEKGIHHDHNH